MHLIAGLGNPGNDYSETKHNFGFCVIDELIKVRSLKLKLGKGDYLYAKDGDCLFLKPTSYMNNSGQVLLEVAKYYKIDIEKILIIYDDIDLPLGKIRYKKSGRDGGHRGIESIIYHLRDDQFNRLKLGIATDSNMRPSEQYVLRPFPKKMNKEVRLVIKNACKSIDYYLKHDLQSTMNNFN